MVIHKLVSNTVTYKHYLPMLITDITILIYHGVQISMTQLYRIKSSYPLYIVSGYLNALMNTKLFVNAIYNIIKYGST